MRGSVGNMEGQHVHQLLLLQQQLLQSCQRLKVVQHDEAVAQVELRKSRSMVDSLQTELAEVKKTAAMVGAGFRV